MAKKILFLAAYWFLLFACSVTAMRCLTGVLRSGILFILLLFALAIVVFFRKGSGRYVLGAIAASIFLSTLFVVLIYFANKTHAGPGAGILFLPILLLLLLSFFADIYFLCKNSACMDNQNIDRKKGA